MATGNTFMDMISRALLNMTSEGIKGVPTNQDLEKIRSKTPEVKMASDSNIDRIMESLLEKYLDMGLSLDAATEAAKKEFVSINLPAWKCRI